MNSRYAVILLCVCMVLFLSLSGCTLGRDETPAVLDEPEFVEEADIYQIPIQTEDSENVETENTEGGFTRTGNFFEVTNPDDLDAAFQEIANEITSR